MKDYDNRICACKKSIDNRSDCSMPSYRQSGIVLIRKKFWYIRLRFEKYEEGLCVRAFHLGDYNKINDTSDSMISLSKKFS